MSEAAVGTMARWAMDYALRPFAIALVFVLVALLWTFPLQHVIAYPFVFLFFGAVMGSAWFGGFVAGFDAVAMSALLIAYFFIPPLYSMSVAKESQSFFTAFILCAIAITVVSSARKRTESAIRETRDQLEQKVHERTAELEQSNLEIQKLLAAQEKLARFSHTLSMAEMAASIAHELNQPLTAVVTHAYACREWLRSEPPNLERATATADKIVQESTRASAVVNRVRALFRKEAQTREATDLNVLIRDLAWLLRDEAGRNRVSIRLLLAEDLPRLDLDPVQMQQVLLNLAMNAMEAMRDSPAPRQLTIRSRRKSGSEVEVSVEDRGPGFCDEDAARLFEPFFTTKPEGTGMGLAICRSIVEAHDGQFWAENLAEGGAAFHFTVRTEI
jgi:C4-dicarboxylate-specific signal transduction histidine kinase